MGAFGWGPPRLRKLCPCVAFLCPHTGYGSKIVAHLLWEVRLRVFLSFSTLLVRDEQLLLPTYVWSKCLAGNLNIFLNVP